MERPFHQDHNPERLSGRVVRPNRRLLPRTDCFVIEELQFDYLRSELFPKTGKSDLIPAREYMLHTTPELFTDIGAVRYSLRHVINRVDNFI